MYLTGHLGELGPFGRGDPREVQPSLFNPNVLQQVFQEREFPTGVVITFQVMAFARVSPGHPNPIRTVPERGQDEFRAHPAGTGHADDPKIGRVLESAHTGQVRSPVAAPIAKEGGNFRLPIIHVFFLSLEQSRLTHP